MLPILRGQWAHKRVPLFGGAKCFFGVTTFREGGAHFGIQIFLGYRFFCWDTKTFFGIQKTFFRDTKCCFRVSGNESFLLTKIPKHHKKIKNSKKFFKIKQKKKNEKQQKIFLILVIFLGRGDFLFFLFEQYFDLFFFLLAFPLLAHTTFGPHHFWPRPPLGFNKPFCAQISANHPTLAKGLLFGTICCSCLVFWAMGLRARDPPCPRPPCAGSPVVWCGVSSKFSWVRPGFWRPPPPDSPSGPPLPTPPPPDPLPRLYPPSAGPPPPRVILNKCSFYPL